MQAGGRAYPENLVCVGGFFPDQPPIAESSQTSFEKQTQDLVEGEVAVTPSQQVINGDPVDGVLVTPTALLLPSGTRRTGGAEKCGVCALPEKRQDIGVDQPEGASDSSKSPNSYSSRSSSGESWSTGTSDAPLVLLDNSTFQATPYEAPELNDNVVPSNSPSTRQELDFGRSRTLTESWQLWPNASWFDRASSFQSFAQSTRKRAQHSFRSSNDSRLLVQQYDSSKPLSLQQHANYKHHKWGEDQLCDIDFDSAALDLDISLCETGRISKISNSLERCVRSYASFFLRLGSGAPPCVESMFNNSEECFPPAISTPKDNGKFNSHDELQWDDVDATQVRRLEDLNEAPHLRESNFLGELAVPSPVQVALDNAWSWQRFSQSALRYWLPPGCPRRKSCPRRLRHGDVDNKLAISMYGCPHRDDRPNLLAGCPQRRRRNGSLNKVSKVMLHS